MMIYNRDLLLQVSFFQVQSQLVSSFGFKGWKISPSFEKVSETVGENPLLNESVPEAVCILPSLKTDRESMPLAQAGAKELSPEQ